MIRIIYVSLVIGVLAVTTFKQCADCQIPAWVQPFIPEEVCKLADPDTWSNKYYNYKGSSEEYKVSASLGPKQISHQKITITKHSGPLDLDTCIIEEHISVQGPCTVNNTNIKNGITVCGPTTIKGKKHSVDGSVIIQGGLWTEGMIYHNNLDIVGYLDAIDCEFDQSITAKTTKIVLKNCIVNNITVIDKANHPATIILENCIIKGTIDIKSGHGIIKNKNSNINQKKIVGAIIKYY
ncbi:MAG TPA: hypothetical protein VGW78_00550 [Candidatus Babeliales bacterium]|jgi:hypothetical protein|nr:hypothetical protein [Candidatus Babeliales bacterium]